MGLFWFVGWDTMAFGSLYTTGLEWALWDPVMVAMFYSWMYCTYCAVLGPSIMEDCHQGLNDMLLLLTRPSKLKFI